MHALACVQKSEDSLQQLLLSYLLVSHKTEVRSPGLTTSSLIW